MAVATIVQVQRRRFQGYADPRLPTGVWAAQAALLGDATGGLATITLQFSPVDAARLASEIWNVEQVHMVSTANTTRQWRFRTVNMDTVLGAPLANIHRLQMVSDGSAGSMDGEVPLPLPLFLGSVRAFNVTSGIDMSTNNIDAVTNTVSAQGYIWGARSVLVDGGPARPASGLYGS